MLWDKPLCSLPPVLPQANMAQQPPRSLCGCPWESPHASLTHPHGVPVPLTPGRPGSRAATSPRHGSGRTKEEQRNKRGPKQPFSAGTNASASDESGEMGGIWGGASGHAHKWEGNLPLLETSWVRAPEPSYCGAEL